MTAFALVILLFYLGLNAKTMKHNSLVKWLFIAVVALMVFLLLAIKGCVDNKEVARFERHARQNSENAFTIERNNLNQVIATQEQKFGELKDIHAVLQGEFNDLNNKYRKATGATVVKTEVVMNDVLVPYAVHDTVFKECVPVGTTAKIDSQYYSITATVDSTGLRIDSLKIPVNVAIVQGQPKDKFFKRIFNPSPPSVSVMVSNKYVNIVGVNNFQLRPKKRNVGLKILGGITAIGFAFFAGMASQ